MYYLVCAENIVCVDLPVISEALHGSTIEKYHMVITSFFSLLCKCSLLNINYRFALFFSLLSMLQGMCSLLNVYLHSSNRCIFVVTFLISAQPHLDIFSGSV